ncbi:hypothetical protein LJR220_003355 [Bradyrhizobium sp. LjRoot220]|uniref:hypothetical protein n=1 Tax=Bradyrhizobium sp. LjRoot220 TaxID=3342284 RepID=UPI003ECF468A
MFQRLTGDANRIYWINTDHILSMEVVNGVEKGYAATRIIFINGGSEMVQETPDDIVSGLRV